jgi:hypothetical protein
MSLMRPHRLRVPSGDGALLAEPPLPKACSLLAVNAGRLAGWDYDFQGRRAAWLRAKARQEAVEQARLFLSRHGLETPAALPTAESPLVVTGHQPELFHPGVWVKNFATAGLAQACGGFGLNLIVDNDVLKSTTLRVPHREGPSLRVERIAFDDGFGEIPFEDLKVQNEQVFASFRDRVRERLDPAIADPLIDDFWPRALRHGTETDRVGLRFALARREIEGSWNTHNLELPISLLCQTESFLWFAAHLMAQLPRYQSIHNTALALYRKTAKIRSRHHPVPQLRRQGDWLEAPFWVWRAAEPRRRSLMTRQLATTMELRIDGEDRPFLELPLAPDREACCAVERLKELPGKEIRLRTRALTTTMFARYLLGDLFIHGIGGAQYDVLGDAISREFLGVEPPAYLTLSMTFWLGLGSNPATREQLDATAHLLRDLTFNPDRHLSKPLTPSEQLWAAAKREAIAGPVATRRERRARCATIRRCNETLQPDVEAQRQDLSREREWLLRGLQENALARDRGYALVLHSRQRLRSAMRAVEAATEGR